MGLSENKFVRLSGTRLPEQKPFRGFDITSLIRKDGAEEERASSVNRAESKSTNLGQRSRRLHQSSNMLTSKVWGQKFKISFCLQEKTERAQRWVPAPPARPQTSAWVPPSRLRPTRTPTSSTRASTSSTSASSLQMGADPRLLLIQCCFRYQTVISLTEAECNTCKSCLIIKSCDLKVMIDFRRS